MNVRCFSYVLVLIVLMSGSMTTFLKDADVSAYSPEVITDMTMDCSNPEAHGDHVVYHGYLPGSGFRVFLMNINTGVHTRIVNYESRFPDISGDRIVFRGKSDSNWDLYTYSISSGTITRLTNDADEEQWPKIDGTDIVYSKKIGNDWEVFHIDALTKNFRVLSISSGIDVAANIHDKMVVWQSTPDFYSIIMGHDLRTGMTYELVNNTGYNLTSPDIYGDRLVYSYGSTWDDTVVILQNITAEMFMILSDYNYRSEYPRIFRDNIVFITEYSGTPEIMLFNLDRGYEQRITADSGYKSTPVIWGEHFYYESLRGFSSLYHVLLDIDGDGVPDQKDMFPYDHNEHFDYDGDGMGDYKDYDDDNDGYEDPLDAFPRDPDEWYDFDGDGLGDNQDEDDDNDGIPDIEDPDPRDPNTPIIGLLHDILVRLDEMEGNLLSRINGLEELFDSLSQEDSLTYLEHINISLIDLETALSNVNFTLKTEMDGILGSIDDLQNEVENANDQDQYPPESFFDVYEDLMVDLTEGLFEYLENMMGIINHTAKSINETDKALDALDTLDGIVSDLESMGKDIESQNQEIEDSGSERRSNLFIVIIVLSVWSLILLGLIIVRTSSGHGPYIDDD